MCGIFCSNNFNKYIHLYNKNKERGSFAYGALFLSHSYDAEMKIDGIVELSKNMTINSRGINMKTSVFYYYMGHTQAPTSTKRTFDQDTSHPFTCGLWVVAHNGVLTNDKKLKAKVKNTNHYNEVDSSVIPALLNQYSDEIENEVGAICEVLSILVGTFGLWIYNKNSHNVYVARSGSTLYANMLDNTVSSIPDEGLEELEEGVLYLVTPEGLTSVGGFTKNSPFFLL